MHDHGKLYGSYCYDHAKLPIPATPLLEVFSISIHMSNNEMKTSDDERQLEVYGSIQLTNCLGYTIDLYNRERDNPEVVSLGDSLSLDDRFCGLVSASYSLNFVVDLKDRASDLNIAKGSSTLYYIAPYTFDQIICVDVPGSFGYIVTVCCSMLQHAAVANIEVLCIKQGDNSGYMHGTVVAKYGDTYRYSTQNQNCLPSVQLFKKRKDEQVQAKPGTSLVMSRSMVVFPVYSPLVIELDLSLSRIRGDTNCQLLNHVLEFKDVCLGSRPFILHKDISDHGCCIRVQVTLSNAYARLSNLMKQCEESSFKEHKKYLQFLFYLLRKQVIATTCLRGYPNHANQEIGSSLIELFSIAFFSDKDEGCNINGSIEVCGYSIFNSYESCPLFCKTNGLIETSYLKWPSSECFNGLAFDVELVLKDDEEHLLVVGAIRCTLLNELFWVDQRICSVIPGKNCYLALHYMMFERALSSLVKFSICSSKYPSASVEVFGKIVAYYEYFSGNTTYCESVYYESVLFEAHRNNPLSMAFGSKIPLSKVALCVPVASYLVIESRLSASCPQPDSDPIILNFEGIVKIMGKEDGKLCGVVDECSYSDLGLSKGDKMAQLECSVTVYHQEQPRDKFDGQIGGYSFDDDLGFKRFVDLLPVEVLTQSSKVITQSKVKMSSKSSGTDATSASQ